MIAISLAFHLALAAASLITTRYGSQRLIQAATPGPINVMWAKTVQAPKATAPDKLPGPMVQPKVETPPAEEKPKVVMPEDLPKEKAKPKKPTKEAAEEEARQKALREAIAGLKGSDDDRPVPRADNFPSAGKAGNEGLPAGPGGMGGMLGGNPAVNGYQRQIRQIVIDNFLWIQKDKKLKAEVQFKIDAAGNIISPTITRSSGDYAFDNAAMRATRKSSPLPAPSAEILSDILSQPFIVNFEL